MNLILILGLILSQVPAVRQPGRRWRPATFRGITVGKSKRVDMLRLLGQPRWSRTTPGEGNEHGTTWNNYERVSEFPGPTNVATDSVTGIVIRIDFYPQKLSKEEAVKYFGPRYVITRYAFDPCPGDEDEESVYESPSGPLVSVEYRGRGIAILVGYKDMVTKISYIGGPLGSTTSRCSQ
jgi:hypothetical protein